MTVVAVRLGYTEGQDGRRGGCGSMDSAALLAAISAMDIDERIHLVQAVWDGIAAEAEALEIPQWHKDGLDQRLAAYEQSPSSGSPWEDVKARLQSDSASRP